MSGWILVAAGFVNLMTFSYTLVKIHEAFFRERKDGDAPVAETPYPAMMCSSAGIMILLGASLLIGMSARGS